MTIRLIDRIMTNRPTDKIMTARPTGKNYDKQINRQPLYRPDKRTETMTIRPTDKNYDNQTRQTEKLTARKI